MYMEAIVSVTVCLARVVRMDVLLQPEDSRALAWERCAGQTPQAMYTKTCFLHVDLGSSCAFFA